MRLAGQKVIEPKPPTPPVPSEPDKYPLPAESKRLNLADGEYHIIHQATGVTLESSLSSYVAQGWQAHGEEQQYPRWEQKNKRFIVTVKGKERALDAVAKKNGTQATWYTEPHSGELEQWFLELIGYTSKGLPIVRIINVWTGRSLYLEGGKAANGTRVLCGSPASTPYEYWILEKVVK